jgi:hypothetical protein
MESIEYIPKIIEYPEIPTEITDIEVAWAGLQKIIKDIIVRFNITPNLALDLGVLYGYSTCSLSYYFKKVIGVDTFKEDRYDNNTERPSKFYNVLKILIKFPNIQLIESMYQDYIKKEPFGKYDLIHIDMIHSYQETFDAGDWALQHSDCVIFHDADAIKDVYNACSDLADKYNYTFYLYKPSWGLAILVKK